MASWVGPIINGLSTALPYALGVIALLVIFSVADRHRTRHPQDRHKKP